LKPTLFLLLLIPVLSRAQGDELAAWPRSDIYSERQYYTVVRNVHSLPQLGLSYDNTMSLGAGLSLINIYYTQPRSPYISPSDITLFGTYTLTGYYTAGVHGTNFFRSDLYRLDFAGYMQYLPFDFWGTGYHDAVSRDPTRMRLTKYFGGADFAVRLAPFTYLGAGLRYTVASGRPDDISYLGGQQQRYDCLAASLTFTYETRNDFSYSTRGIYVRLNPRFCPRMSRNDLPWWGVELTSDYYLPLWRGATLALDGHAELNDGNLPWTMMPSVGSLSRMRGYYLGQYRDNSIVEMQAELRQHVVSLLSVAGWVGAANVFPSLRGFDLGHTLPSYGGGIRLQADRYTRVRIDAGFGRKTWGIVAGLHEAF